ncbi:hypothetical protein CCM_05075 [Cordyceps militaris CM01]|uniref:Uncharacterized protein n=1 Tax=Cordyceps militaris (strain CM01) TaxID=983644 RepID=G3JHL1_CORMM|nr:uncharacterized protein CCM_05075 [Cordyceps militaris CM01]EGX90919.1 hypothetical protein CCM_05075 [Cordyceps militaris CM01]
MTKMFRHWGATSAARNRQTPPPPLLSDVYDAAIDAKAVRIEGSPTMSRISGYGVAEASHSLSFDPVRAALPYQSPPVTIPCRATAQLPNISAVLPKR